MAEADRSGEQRQPEVEEPVRAHGEDGVRERNAGPGECERDQHLHRARTSQREGAPRQGVAGRIADQHRREIRLCVECAQACPQAGDVAEPVERRAEKRTHVLAGLRAWRSEIPASSSACRSTKKPPRMTKTPNPAATMAPVRPMPRDGPPSTRTSSRYATMYPAYAAISHQSATGSQIPSTSDIRS